MTMNAGKSRRLRRLVDRAGRTVILPLDIIVPVGPFPGAGDTGALIDMAGEVGVSAVILRWGEAGRYAARLAPDVGLIVRASGATTLAGADPPLATLNTALACVRVGADAVCLDLELGSERETESSRAFARVCEEADELGLVVLGEVHVPDAALRDEREPGRALAWAARTARELGADLVKVSHPGSAEAVAAICELAGIPVVIAGGALREPEDVLRIADEACRGGAAGTAFGRNVIGHVRPAEMQRAVIDLVRRGESLHEARERLAVARDGGGTR